MALDVDLTAHHPEDPTDARGGFTEPAIRAQLERLQHSQAFARAHRLLYLLFYLVEHSRTASDRDLHESIIGIEHFRRGSDFDCQTDTIVRVNARRLRDRLAEYYRDEGAADPIRFEIPKGRYRVLFHPGTTRPAPEPAAPSPPAPLPAIDAHDLTRDTAASTAAADALVAPEAPSAAPQQRRWPFYPVAAFVVVGAAAVVLFASGTREGERREEVFAPKVPASATSNMEVRQQLALARFYYSRRAAGDVALALEHFERVLALDKSVADAWVGVAKSVRVLWLGQGLLSTEEALVRQFAALRTALSLDPFHAEAHVRIATLYRRWLKDPEAASRSMALALRYGGEDPEVLSIVAGYRALQSDLEGAIEALRSSLEREPTNAVYRTNLGSYLLMAGRLEEAREELLNARRLNPGGPGIELDLVEALIGLDRRAEARAVVADMAPGPEAVLAGALLGAADGPIDSTLRTLEGLAASGIASQTILALRGYLSIGDLDRAVACLERSGNLLSARESLAAQDTLDLYNIYLSPSGRRASGHPGWERWWQGAGLIAWEDGAPSLADW